MTKRMSLTPGLKWRDRAGGKVPYWIAPEDAVKQGFSPPTQRLLYDPDKPDFMESLSEQCLRLQDDVRFWKAERAVKRPARYDGDLGSLIDVYRADRDGPYFELRQNTRAFYDYGLDLLKAHAGTRHLDKVTGRDFRKWYAHLRQPAPLTPKQIAAGITSNPERVRRAYAAMQMLRVVIGYGVTEKLPACKMVRDVLEEMEFESSARRESQMTYPQVCAFRAKAHEFGRPSMALGVTLQFDLSMRQGDVIGKWERDGKAQRWAGGLTWTDIKGSILTKRTSKTGTKVEHDLSRLPDTQAELALIPAERRVGPLVICEGTGLPYKRRFYAAEFRRIARLAEIPDDVWSMDARAGAVTEALDAGAEDSDVMNTAGHTQLSTTQRYNRSSLKKTARVAALRVASRNSGA